MQLEVWKWTKTVFSWAAKQWDYIEYTCDVIEVFTSATKKASLQFS